MWVIANAEERYLVYDGRDAPMAFATREQAEKCMREANWHFAGMLVGELVDGVVQVDEGTHNPFDW